ncbi:hypothetical protein [Roseibium sp.]|uniref:hypothetical protein n=1 Tax=Roseibium sp. TaxID=1936156 RepID=UPI003A9848FD
MNDPITRKPSQARQGERGRPVLAVLLTSIIIVVGAFFALGLINADGEMASLGAIDTPPETATN